MIRPWLPLELRRGQKNSQSGEREGGGEDVRVRQTALRVPDRIDRGECSHNHRQTEAEETSGELKHRQKSSGRKGAGHEAGDEDVKSEQVPGETQDDAGQRWMGVGELGDQRPAMEEIQRGRDVVAAFVPKVRQPEQRKVRQGDGAEEQEVDGKEATGPRAARSEGR